MVGLEEPLRRGNVSIAAGRATLSSRGWLAQTPPDFREALLDSVVWRTTPAGGRITHAGDTQGGLVGIAAGVAEVSADVGHPDTRFVHLIHPGVWGGYRPLLGKPRNASMSARTKTLWALVPQQAVANLLARQPEGWRHIALLVDLVSEQTREIMVDLTRQQSLLRAVGALLRLAGCRNGSPGHDAALEIKVPQGEIAALAVMGRNSMGSHLGELAQKGLIEVGYRSVRLVDVDGLRALLEQEE